MEKLPNKEISNDKTEEEIREEAKKAALEKVKQKVAVVNIEDIAEAEARKAADARMTESAGKSGLFKRIWKHTFFDEYYRQKEVNRVREEIKNTGDIYTARVNNKIAHENAVKGISDRFISEYEGTLSEGEDKKILDDKTEEATATKDSVKKLITDYATGALNDEAFVSEKVRILDSLKKDELLKGANNYADNLFEIAKNAKLAIEHGAKVEELELDTDMIIGKAKSSLKTEAHFNMVDRGIDYMKKSKVGRFVSPAVLSTAIGLAYSISVGVSKKVMSSKAAAWGTFGASVAISSVFAGANESQRVALERKQHGIEMAEGSGFKEGDKRREEMNKYQYKMESSGDLAQSLRSLMFETDKDGKEIPKEMNPDDLDKVLASLANIEARNSLNSKNKIDLISYSEIGNVEKERTDLTILTARAKVELRKKMEAGLKNPNTNGKDFDTCLAEQTKIIEDSLLGGENGINENDKEFSKYKTKRVAKKVAATVVSGLLIGGAIQEGVAFFRDDVQGFAEGLIKGNDGHASIQTPFEHIHKWIMGGTENATHMGLHNPIDFNINGHDFKLPDGASMIQNPDGTYNILMGSRVLSDHIPLNFDSSGALDAASVAQLGHDGIIANSACSSINSVHEVNGSAEEYIKNHLANTKHIARDGWYDNNTPKPIFDQNELKLQWGGTGVDTNGNYVLDVSHMTSDGSYHGELSVDAQAKIHEGGLKMIMSLTGGTQNQVFEVPIDTQGHAVIDPNSEVGKLFFGNENGHAIFKGRFAEVVQSFGEKDGAEHVKTLATLVGNGNDSIPDTIPLPTEITINNLDLPIGTEPPYFIPVVARNPLEPVTPVKKKGSEDSKPNGGGIKEHGGESHDQTGEKVVVAQTKEIIQEDKIITTGSEEKVVDKKLEKKETNEISAAEYQAMQDDIKMINKRIQESKGIITVTKDDFKSEYGRKRYFEEKSIKEGIPVTFNKAELPKIGDEIETILRNSSSIKKVEEKVPEKIKPATEDFEIIKVKRSSGEIEDGWRLINVEDGKAVVMKKTDKPGEFLRKIIPESELREINPKKQEEKKEEQLIQKRKFMDAPIEIGKVEKKATGLLDQYGNPIKPKEVIAENKEEPKVETKKENIEAPAKQKEVKQETKEVSNESVIKPAQPIESASSTPEQKKVYTHKDFSKVGTEFEDKDGSKLKVTRVWKSGLGYLGRLKDIHVEAIFKDKDGKEKLTSYTQDYLKNLLEIGNIKITNTVEKK